MFLLARLCRQFMKEQNYPILCKEYHIEPNTA
jgi:hypothetical protein